MVRFKIGSRMIGEGCSPFVVAEIGVNYENSMKLAEAMIIAAKQTGADAVKFQTYKADRLVAKDAPKFWEDETPEETQEEFYARSNTFYHRETRELLDLCDKYKIIGFSTPFDLESVDMLDEAGVPVFKIASADITNKPLLIAVAKKGKPVFLSTGATFTFEIEDALKVLRENGCKDIVLLHCILSYPTPMGSANLETIPYLAKQFPDCLVGWSDHVLPFGSIVAPTVAVALGASVIEKHFTIDRMIEGNDHYHSVNEEQMRMLVNNVYNAWASGGYGKAINCRVPLNIEQPARDNARRSVAALVDIPKGTTIKRKHLTVLRPGSGIHPWLIDMIVGLKTKKDIKRQTIIARENIDWSRQE